MDRKVQIDTFSRYSQVSRETINSLIKYEELLIHSNKSLNLIGNSTIKYIWHRHFLDSLQAIDFIDKNQKTLVDLGSGAGFPGLVLSIIAKERKIPLKIKLIEKSKKKINFLKKIITKLNLNAVVIYQNVEDEKFHFIDDTFVARAFKPLSKIFELMHNKAQNFKKIIIFLGKNGQDGLLQASKNWDIKYKQRMSVTSNDSFIIEVNKLIKK
ncbi:16S rRNA (guanine(527)-N(7))-methyltransferase RsmG [Pelagibacteraceae bacterium]|nr:16S rRNA (guanine(527)-N(7))-methyltransferase RsmG [Pelagibacteraceae bacterium]